MDVHPDLLLPDRIPEMERHHSKPSQVLPFALYALCALSDEELAACRQQCVADIDCDDNIVQLAPKAVFKDQSLRIIVEYHVELGFGGQFDGKFFIVVVHPSSYTVLVVALDDDELQCKPDLLWSKIGKSGLVAANLGIGIIMWDEAKDHSMHKIYACTCNLDVTFNDFNLTSFDFHQQSY